MYLTRPNLRTNGESLELHIGLAYGCAEERSMENLVITLNPHKGTLTPLQNTPRLLHPGKFPMAMAFIRYAVQDEQAIEFVGQAKCQGIRSPIESRSKQR